MCRCVNTCVYHGTLSKWDYRSCSGSRADNTQEEKSRRNVQLMMWALVLNMVDVNVMCSEWESCSWPPFQLWASCWAASDKKKMVMCFHIGVQRLNWWKVSFTFPRTGIKLVKSCANLFQLQCELDTACGLFLFHLCVCVCVCVCVIQLILSLWVKEQGEAQFPGRRHCQ